MGNANINRGKKWTTARKIAVFENRTADVNWIDGNVSIQEDIKAFNDSTGTNETKSKGKK